MKYIIFLVSILLAVDTLSAQTISIVEQSRSTSIRGLSVVDEKVAWVSGSKGHVALSTNGGQTWTWQQVKGFEQSDFRDIEAFSAKEAIIMSSGTPAVILKTTDGGLSWQLCYREDDKTYFLDGLAFYDKMHGISMGDPINGKFLLLETKDGGKTWTEESAGPDALKNEAAFAASGTSVYIVNKKANAVVLTGGSVSRLLYRTKAGTWNPVTMPLAQGQASKGGFSVATGGGQTVLVGGNYSNDKNRDSIACYYNGEQITGSNFHLAATMPNGYQSCVTYIEGKVFLSTGTSGSNVSYDGGLNWKPVDAGSYNVCQRSKKGKLVLLAGDKGRIAIFKL
ncbi:YCF48-related protein [Mucilaginibacter galii]|uniref:WD40/YVTN/BNR-like repeat-containing protein n=1 Tax=Mucilaginibacter galii TaxID=2005073 RepID=UPI00166ADF5A|nr:YCF48-related protein [Mucilaginibacter galii]